MVGCKRNTFMAIKSMVIAMFTSATSHLKFAQERCVTSSEHEGPPAWTRTKPSPSRQSHWNTYRPHQARIYHNGVELHQCWKGQYGTKKISFQTHHMTDDVVVKQMTPGRVQFDYHSVPPKKKEWGDIDTCKQYYMITWKCGLWLLSIQVKICFW